MSVKKIVYFSLLTLFSLSIIYFIYFKYTKKTDIAEIELNKTDEEVIYKSNIIKDVNYTTKDADGNEYVIKALQGEIDFENPSIFYLTKVNATIYLNNAEVVIINSDFGKYNSDNFDTIFTKNVIINYLDNIINGEYLDFSLERNSMIISKDVVYNNLKNTLKADVIEINIKTKDTKIFMYEKEKKVKIKSKN